MYDYHLEELMNDVLQQLSHLDFADNTIKKTEYCFTRMKAYAMEQAIFEYSSDVFDLFILDLEKQCAANLLHHKTLSKFKQSIFYLEQVFKGLPLAWRVRYPDHRPLTNLYATSITGYQKHTLDQLSSSTIYRNIGIGKMIFRFAESLNLYNFDDWTLTFLNSFLAHMIETRPQSTRSNLTSLRSIFSYLMTQKYLDASFLNALNFHTPDQRNTVNTFTMEEVSKILSVIDRTTTFGKRNYAMILLAIYTGMRGIDIVNLKLMDIHWKQQTISFIQSKTKNPTQLPLHPKVGNAISDYILHARPKTKSPHIFIRSKAPYSKVSDAGKINTAFREYRELAFPEKFHNYGLHTMRKSLATLLLEKETPYALISEILGHHKLESTMVYLSADEQHLKSCCLPMADFPCRCEEWL